MPSRPTVPTGTLSAGFADAVALGAAEAEGAGVVDALVLGAAEWAGSSGAALGAALLDASAELTTGSCATGTSPAARP